MLFCQLLAGKLITLHPALDAPEDFAITPEEFPWKERARGGARGDGQGLGGEVPARFLVSPQTQPLLRPIWMLQDGHIHSWSLVSCCVLCIPLGPSPSSPSPALWQDEGITALPRAGRSPRCSPEPSAGRGHPAAPGLVAGTEQLPQQVQEHLAMVSAAAAGRSVGRDLGFQQKNLNK